MYSEGLQRAAKAAMTRRQMILAWRAVKEAKCQREKALARREYFRAAS